MDFIANSYDQGSIKIYQNLDDEYFKFYDDIKTGMYLLVNGVGWFIIKECRETRNIAQYKEITFVSLEYELSQTYLTSFGAMGIDEDEQGGLDRYCLNNLLDQEHSILHIIVKKNPAWTIKYVDHDIINEYRNFQVDRIDTYSFLMDNVASAFECVFLFDTFDRSISAYKIENVGVTTPIFLSYRNLVKQIEIGSDDSDIKTVFTVAGGNDARTNTPLGIIDINVGGTNQIVNYGYYLDMMSGGLRERYKEFEISFEKNEPIYQEEMTKLGALYSDLETLKNKVPSTTDSEQWSEYGLSELETKQNVYWGNMGLYTTPDDKELYDKNKDLYNAVGAEIVIRRQQISDKQNEIDCVINRAKALIVNIQDFLGDELYRELSLFNKEDTFTEDSFIVTEIMTDSEILKMQQSLLEHSKNELKKVCYPRYTMEVDAVNFTRIFEFKSFSDDLVLFNKITIEINQNKSIQVRLLKFHVNWDNASDFSITLSNQNTLEETWHLLEELKKQTDNMSSHLEYSIGAWNDNKQVSKTFKEFQNDVFDASKQQIVNSENQEFLVDSTGLLLRKWIPEKADYDDIQLRLVNRQLAMTTDKWNTVSLALGHIKVGNDYFYGLNCEHLCGKILLSNQVYISNTSGSYTIDKDGFIAKKGPYEVKINPDTPDNIFAISIDNKKFLYVDTVAKALTFEGKLISKFGQIADFIISDNTLISGNVGICSDKTAGSIAYWAGGTDKNNAPFRVTNTGALTCSNVSITGGSLKIGENFEVNAQGVLTAKTGNFSGDITGSYIEGGEIKISKDPDKDFFHVYEDMIQLGDFEVTYSDRGLLQSSGGYSGFSAQTHNGNFCLWAGFTGGAESNIDNYAMAVNTGGQLYAKEMIITDSWWKGWSITRTMKQVYERLQRAEDAINALRDKK